MADFHYLSRQEAQCLLIKKGVEGSFLVRHSQSCPGNYALSVKVKDRVLHYLIFHQGHFYAIYKCDKFVTLPELVQYYIDNPGLLRGSVPNNTPILLTQTIQNFSKSWFEEIISERWLHRGIHRQDAEMLLLSKGQHGSYLVRTSTHSPGNFALTIRVMDEISHIMIQHIGNKFCISNGPQFNTLSELVEYYEKNTIVESDGHDVDLWMPFCCSSFLPYHIMQRVSELSKPSDKLYGKTGFEDEYQQIVDDDTCNHYNCKEGGKPENCPKNRFENILPFDHTRVILKDPDPSGNTYINANYVSGEIPNSKYSYIATQGCLPTTINDFWSMVWQEKSMIIVMITNEVERGRDKCAHYWPDHKETLLFGRVKITCLNEIVHSCFIVRHFLLNDNQDVFQYQFKAWPDHGVHNNPQDILNFRENINLKMKELIDAGHTPGPLVVHCSAGIGRTGTYIAIDIIIKAIEHKGWGYRINIQRTVMSLRTHRSGMVQTEDQYQFVYHTIQKYVDTYNNSSTFSIGYPNSTSKLIKDQEQSDHKTISVSQGIEPPINTIELKSDQEESDHKTLSNNQIYFGVLDHALKEGRVKVKWTKLSVSGPPGTGKSSVMKLLLDEDPPDNHKSTPVARVPEIRMVTTTPLIVGKESTDSSINSPAWGKVDPDSMKSILAQAIKKAVISPSSIFIPECQVESLPLNEAYNLKTPSNSNPFRAPALSSPQAPDNGVAVFPPTPSVPNFLPYVHSNIVETTPQLSPTMTKYLSPQVSSTTKEILELLPNVPETALIFESHWIYAVDSGGQAAFLDIAPALLRYNSVNILTHKLDEKLEDKVKFYYSIDGEQIGNLEERQITHLQLLETSFRSLTSVNPPNLLNIKALLKTSSLILGTFFDKILDSCESLDAKNATLLSTLKRYNEFITVYSAAENQIIFPINAVSRGLEEIKMADTIRHEVCKSYIEAEIPIRWFLFQLDIEKFQRTNQSHVISKSVCYRIGEALKMNHKEVKAALMYYHDLTMYLYFPEVLPNIVFVEPQSLFDKLSQLISISFAEGFDCLRKIPNVSLSLDDYKALKTKGIFSRNLFSKSLSQGFSKEFSADDFLKLMENLFILSPLPQSGEYFLPCVLPTATLKLLETFRAPFKECVKPLVLTWNESPLPQGLFPALIVKLLSCVHEFSPTFKLLTTDSGNQQYRNAIHLVCTNLGGVVLLIDAIYWIELFYSGRQTTCYHIRQVVKEGIDAVVDKFHYMRSLKKPEEQFHCSNCETTEHFCYLSEDKEMLTCCETKKICPINEIHQKPWFILISEVECQSTHEEMFRTHFYELSQLILVSEHRLSLAPKLYSACLITRECYINATDNSPRTDQEKGLSLVNSLLCTVNTQPQLLTKMVDVLGSIEAFQSVAEKLKH